MKKTDWMDAIGKIDPVYVKEAEQWNKAAQKKRTIRHFTAMAACVCVLLIGAVSTFTLFFNRGDVRTLRDHKHQLGSRNGRTGTAGKPDRRIRRYQCRNSRSGI